MTDKLNEHGQAERSTSEATDFRTSFVVATTEWLNVWDTELRLPVDYEVVVKHLVLRRAQSFGDEGGRVVFSLRLQAGVDAPYRETAIVKDASLPAAGEPLLLLPGQATSDFPIPIPRVLNGGSVIQVKASAAGALQASIAAHSDKPLKELRHTETLEGAWRKEPSALWIKNC